MCLGVPMRIKKKIDDSKYIAELGGVEREVLTTLIDDIKVGDYVIVHTGFAINKLDLKEAEDMINLIKEMKS